MHLQRIVKKGNDKAKMVAIECLQKEGVPPNVNDLMKLVKSDNPYAQWRSVSILGDLGVKKAIPLLKKALASTDSLTRSSAHFALDKLGVPLKLYQGHNLDPAFTRPKKGFIPRAVQAKSHQSTILLGGSLFNKALVKGKRIRGHSTGYTQAQLDYWLKALNHDWKRAGWKYNPVEPILKKPNGKYRYYKNKDGTFRVSAGVIRGQNAGSFLLTNNSKESKDFVMGEMNKIVAELKGIGIHYAHPKPDNFIIQRIGKKLRVFIIDFDYVWGVNESPEKAGIVMTPRY
jgi:hypothetical protein